MPYYDANGIILTSFPFACGQSEDVTKANKVLNKAMELNDGNYVMLRNFCDVGSTAILSHLEDSKKPAVNHVEQTILALAFIATTKGSAFNTLSQKHTWIIDSSATDHMTLEPRQLITHKSSMQSVVSNSNGILSPMVGDNSISLSNFIHLDYVLIVPSFDHNLLYVA
ncbi:hypothetical protein L3X38_000325 [Prunus dulcis]|uniref:Retrovirus-related Pol polyprotein from transposon TNT 1-94-like beta-barrel domain-containing protein n=1 Tax=Prunus dulcis TaxID=3755 RepID=A0AAD4USN6_PRUDU|nr:hypothetical protein L3X38_000325 [Prunus dulcis]